MVYFHPGLTLLLIQSGYSWINDNNLTVRPRHVEMGGEINTQLDLSFQFFHMRMFVSTQQKTMDRT